jgi:hypothetical protein
MGSEDINTQRVLDAVKKCILASCMKVPKAPDPDFEEIKRRMQKILADMAEKGVISSSTVRIIEDTPAEKLVREIMEEEEDTIRTEIELSAIPLTYLTVKLKVDGDS